MGGSLMFSYSIVVLVWK